MQFPYIWHYLYKIYSDVVKAKISRRRPGLSRPRLCPEAKDLTLKAKAWMSKAKASKFGLEDSSLKIYNNNP